MIIIIVNIYIYNDNDNNGNDNEDLCHNDITGFHQKLRLPLMHG